MKNDLPCKQTIYSRIENGRKTPFVPMEPALDGIIRLREAGGGIGKTIPFVAQVQGIFVYSGVFSDIGSIWQECHAIHYFLWKPGGRRDGDPLDMKEQEGIPRLSSQDVHPPSSPRTEDLWAGRFPA
jgi:hypothetical protein